MADMTDVTFSGQAKSFVSKGQDSAQQVLLCKVLHDVMSVSKPILCQPSVGKILYTVPAWSLLDRFPRKGDICFIVQASDGSWVCLHYCDPSSRSKGVTGTAPSDATPLMDGVSAAGSSDFFARGDHVHPTDTTRAADNEVVKLSGDQSVGGIKTFSDIPVLPNSDPSGSNDAARKAYVDSAAAGALSAALATPIGAYAERSDGGSVSSGSLANGDAWGALITIDTNSLPNGDYLAEFGVDYGITVDTSGDIYGTLRVGSTTTWASGTNFLGKRMFPVTVGSTIRMFGASGAAARRITLSGASTRYIMLGFSNASVGNRVISVTSFATQPMWVKLTKINN